MPEPEIGIGTPAAGEKIGFNKSGGIITRFREFKVEPQPALIGRQVKSFEFNIGNRSGRYF
jgi:hypothetical protein